MPRVFWAGKKKEDKNKMRRLLTYMAIIVVVAPLMIGLISLYQATVQDLIILKSKFYFFELESPEPTMVVVYLTRNLSSSDIEIIYDLTSDVGIGGIEAIIDSDGPFGPKEPETYHWKKVPLAANGEQYLIVTFPLPDDWIPGTKVIPSVRIVPEPRG